MHAMQRCMDAHMHVPFHLLSHTPPHKPQGGGNPPPSTTTPHPTYHRGGGITRWTITMGRGEVHWRPGHIYIYIYIYWYIIDKSTRWLTNLCIHMFAKSTFPPYVTHPIMYHNESLNLTMTFYAVTIIILSIGWCMHFIIVHYGIGTWSIQVNIVLYALVCWVCCWDMIDII